VFRGFQEHQSFWPIWTAGAAERTSFWKTALRVWPLSRVTKTWLVSPQ
jgi:hypothetical protein